MEASPTPKILPRVPLRHHSQDPSSASHLKRPFTFILLLKTVSSLGTIFLLVPQVVAISPPPLLCPQALKWKMHLPVPYYDFMTTPSFLTNHTPQLGSRSPKTTAPPALLVVMCKVCPVTLKEPLAFCLLSVAVSPYLLTSTFMQTKHSPLRPLHSCTFSLAVLFSIVHVINPSSWLRSKLGHYQHQDFF